MVWLGIHGGMPPHEQALWYLSLFSLWGDHTRISAPYLDMPSHAANIAPLSLTVEAGLEYRSLAYRM